MLKYAEANCIATLVFGAGIGLLDADGEKVPMGVGKTGARSALQY